MFPFLGDSNLHNLYIILQNLLSCTIGKSYVSKRFKVFAGRRTEK